MLVEHISLQHSSADFLVPFLPPVALSSHSLLAPEGGEWEGEGRRGEGEAVGKNVINISQSIMIGIEHKQST